MSNPHKRLSLKKRIFSNSSGFTLIELAVVLMIVGIIAGAVFKGQDLLEAAKARAVLNDFNRFKIAVTLYQETYGALPGDDNNAQKHFGEGVESGDGNGILSDRETVNAWQHLAKGGFLNSSKAPTSKLGGKFNFVYQPHPQLSGHWIQLGKENGDQADNGLLTPKQAQMLKSKAEEGTGINPLEGNLRVIEGRNIPTGQCVQGDHLNLSVNDPVCIVLMQF